MAGRKYYEAYDERYKTAHAAGINWFSDAPSPIVGETLERCGIRREMRVLELGCGEGRDAAALLAREYNLLATDVSPEAVSCCKRRFPAWKDRFQRLDCVSGELEERFAFIYAVALLHMLVPDEDRMAFYGFVREHLTESGFALICTMGDGAEEWQSDIRTAFELRERECALGTLQVAGTSCRVVSSDSFEREIAAAALTIVERGFASVPPDFPEMMYAVVKRA